MVSNAVVAFSAVAGFAVIVYLYKSVRSRKRPKKTVPKGTVLLHQFAPLRRLAVNASPPCLKLETYLRMAKIPYQVDDRGFQRSSKGKLPWIEYNNKSIADSKFCIQFLNEEFGVDVDSHLSERERAISHIIITALEENTYWTMVYYRWVSPNYAPFFRDMAFSSIWFPLRYIIFSRFQRTTRGYLYGHGIGRHSEQDIYGIGEKDLRSYSEILGNKEFLFGSKPCLADAALFGLVASFIYVHNFPATCPQEKLIRLQLNNLASHAERMKTTFFPDWDEIISKKYRYE